MKILITGANGQLGQEMQHLLDGRGQEYLAEDSQGLDITDKEAVDTYFEKNKPEVVYHCAAYTAASFALPYSLRGPLGSSGKYSPLVRLPSKT